MYKFLFFFCTIFLMSFNLIYSQAYSISLAGPSGGVAGTAENQFVIQVKVGDPNAVNNFLGASFNLTWDNTTYIEAVSSTAGAFLGNNPLIITQNYGDHIEAGVTSSTGGKNGSGIIVSCTLKVKQTVSGTITAHFNLENITGMDGIGNSVILTPANNPLNVVIESLPVLSVTPDNQSVSSSAGTTSFSVTNTGGGTMNWTASENSDWINITSGSSGTNTGTINLSYTANTNCEARVCTLTVTAPGVSGSPKTVTITQPGSGTPVLSVTPLNQDVSSASGTTAFTVSNTGCGTMNWTASESSDWVNITSGSTGTNSGTINLSYTANTGTTVRICTLTVAASGAGGSPKTLTITQQPPQPQQQASISMTGPASVTGTAENQFVIQIKVGDPNAVTNFLGSSFNLTWDNTAYIEAVSTTAGSFLGNNPLIVAQNFTDHIEIGATSTSGGKNGSGVIAVCTLKVKQTVSGTITAHFNLQNISGMDGSGGSVTLTPVNNPLNVIIETLPVLSVTPENRTVGTSPGTTSFTVSNTGGGTLNWSAAETSDWVAITSGSTGTNNGTINLSYTSNTGCETRVCTLTVTASGASGSPKTVTITQPGSGTPVLSVTPLNQDVSSASGTTAFTVSNTGCGTMNWTASESSDWVNITSGNTGTNSGTINLSYTANTGTTVRVCTLTVAASGAGGSPKTLTITQQPQPQQQASISMTGPSSVTGIAENQFVIQIKVGDPNAVTNFLGASCNLTWDNTAYIEAVSTTAGSFLGSNPLIIAQNFSDHIEIGATSTSGGKNGTGVIAQCTLKVKQTLSGAVTIHFNLQNISGLDGSGNNITLLPVNNPLNVLIELQPVLTVTPDNQTVSASPGTTSFSVNNTGGGTMNWSASESSDWVNITSGSSGTNAGTINISYTSNTGCETRVCTLTVTASGASGTPKTVTITQPGSGTPILTVSPLTQDLPSTAGTAAINVSNTGCGTMNWSASENSDWINITDGSSGTNSGTINISYSANTGCETRVCTLTVTASGASGTPKTVTITQPGSGTPILTVSPLTQDLPSTAGTTTINVSNTGCGTMNWTASESSDWVNITSGSSGTNAGTINISYTSNTGCETRVCTLTVTAAGAAGSPKTVTITQPGSGTPILTVSPLTQDLPSTAGTTAINVSNTGCGTMNWSASENSDWMNITSGSSGTNSGTINISYSANTGCETRVCTLTIAAQGVTGSSKLVTLTQPGSGTLILTVSPLTQDLPSTAGTAAINVSNTGCGTMNWTASESSDWVSITSGTTGTNAGTINISYTSNTGCETRVCTLTVAAQGVTGSPKLVTITQPGSGTPVLFAVPLSQELPSSAGTTEFNISNQGCGNLNWMVTETSDWVTITDGTAGVNAGLIKLSYSANVSCETRICSLTVTSEGAAGSPKILTLTQPGGGKPILEVTPLEHSVSPEEGIRTFTISNSGCGIIHWNASVREGSDWLTIDEGAAGADSGEIKCSYQANKTSKARTAKIIIYNSDSNDDSVLVSITQDFTSGVFDDQTVTEYCLYQNYPNPFNPTTVIRYSLPEEGKVTIRLFDVLGNEITTIVDDYKSPGMYSVELDASSITSGIYYYRITANNFVHTKKMILVK